MDSYFQKLSRELTRAAGDVEPFHFGVLAAIVVVVGFMLLRGMSISR